MKFTEAQLKAMGVKELKARLKEINTEAEAAKAEEVDALVKEAEFINDLIQAATGRQTLAKMAADHATVEPGEDEPGEDGEEPKNKIRDERGGKLKAGSTVKFAAKKAFAVNGALSVTQTVTPKHTASDVKETFNDVSSLVDRVKVVPLDGGESYQRGYVKAYGDGAGSSAEGADYNLTEPVFGYVQIQKQKITAYTEEPEEMIKLPNADYDGIVEGSITKAVRRYMTRQIMIGDGTTGKFKGIFHNPVAAADRVIDPATDVEITEITNTTLDEIIYSLGGEEEVEDTAVIILNKKDLKAFAMLRDNQDRKVYTIVNRGNTGTIDSVPYIINSACKAISDATTAAGDYVMAYGPLMNYELCIFSDIDAKKSTDYKFKQGQIAYRADIFAGGAVAAYNGFVRVKKLTA